MRRPSILLVSVKTDPTRDPLPTIPIEPRERKYRSRFIRYTFLDRDDWSICCDSETDRSTASSSCHGRLSIAIHGRPICRLGLGTRRDRAWPSGIGTDRHTVACEWCAINADRRP